MELKTKPDLPAALERMEAWWQCEIVDRPPVTIHVRSDRTPDRPTKHHDNVRDRWFDLDYRLDCHAAEVEAGVFFAEHFPRFMPNLGPELTATLYGCELEFSETTSWSVPIVERCRDICNLQPDLDTPYWNWIRRATDESLRRGRGLWLTGLPDLHTNGDLPAALRDPQGMCLDLADDLDGVRAACDHVTDAYATMYDDLWARIDASGQPCTTWTPFLHAGRAYVTSCDFICMISSEMFRRTILPGIVREMEFLERNIFHLDGPGALTHLDDLLAQPELDAVQWVYGAGQGPAARWIDVYRRIQAAGKGIQLQAQGLDDARTVAEHLKPEGVWFTPGGSYDRAEAEAFLDWTARWAAGKA